MGCSHGAKMSSAIMLKGSVIPSPQRGRRAVCWPVVAGLLFSGAALADDWDLHGQATWIWQGKAPFRAAYSGPRSLSNVREKSYSFTSTAALVWRLGPSTELYANPEVVQGVPLSGLMGLGGLTNGELQKTAGAKPVGYLARAFVRHTIDAEDVASGESEEVPSSFNQMATRLSRHRWVITLGQFAVSDIFDANRFAHDGRTQFLNWSFLTHGAYDFAADARGYSQGVAVERYQGDWTWRWGRFNVPRESNGLALDHQWLRHYGDQWELQHDHSLQGQKGALRLLMYRNRAVMAAYDDAMTLAPGGGWWVKDFSAVRKLQSKWGWGCSLEQDFRKGVGGFVRWARHDGKTEGYSFASIDQSVSAGLTVSNSAWLHPQEEWSVAWAANGLSQPHRRYLAAGGVDFFIGDGALRYASETIVEAMYSVPLGGGFKASFNLQHIKNPGYNQDRGPVRLAAVRLHADF